MPSLHLALFGSPRLERDGEQVALGRRKAIAILALLAVSGEPQSRELLLALLWPDYDASSGRANLRRDLSYLRRYLGGEHLIADHNQVQLDLSAGLSLDVRRFRELLSEEPPGRSVERAAEAVGLYIGEFMAGFDLPDAPDFDEWLFFERESLRHQLAVALQQLLYHHSDRGESETAIGYGRRWLALDPLHEPPHRALMKLYAWSGQQAAALRQYEECVRLLDEDLGVAPEEETAALYKAIRLRQLEAPVRLEAQRPEQDVTTSPSRPEASTIEPLPPLVAPSPLHILPAQATPFFGREEELAELAQLIADPEVRLVTIVGPGGIGKTRLSLAAAERAINFRDGVYFVPLAPLESAANIVSAIAEALDYRSFGELDPWRQLLNYLSQKRLLLVLDNFEHLLHGGAAVVAELLQEATAIKLLTTSRERLHLSGEAVYRIAGLAYPEDAGDPYTADALSEYGAISLLLQQARLMRPGQEPDEQELLEVARICRLVQGMPLAIVLAAGWLELLSFKEIGDEIANNLDILEGANRDMPPRQRSMRAAFAYSWGQLSDVEKDAFIKLSVFRGGFTRRAAEEVAGAGLRVLRALGEKSLLVASRPERYEVHELLRQFAAEKLAESGAAAETRTAHSVYYLHALAVREADLKGRRQVEALAEIDTDLENVRAAWNWATRQRMEANIAEALNVIYLYFHIRGRFQEGANTLELARLVWEADKDSLILARIIVRGFWLKSTFGEEAPQSEADLTHCREVAQACGDEQEVAIATFSLGYYHSRLKGDNEMALPFYEAARDQFRALGDDFYLAWALVRLGYAKSTGSETDAFLDHTRQGLELARETGNKMQIAAASMNLGSGLRNKGEYGAAESLFKEAATIGPEMGYRMLIAQTKAEMSLLHLAQGNLARAKALATEALETANETGFPLTKAYATAQLALDAALNGNYAEALRLGRDSLAYLSNPNGEWFAHWALAIAYCGLRENELARHQLLLTLRLAVEYQWEGFHTWLLPVAAALEYHAGRDTRALELLSLAMHHPLSATGWIERWALVTDMRADLERRLHPADFQAAWERGKELDLQETAVALL